MRPSSRIRRFRLHRGRRHLPKRPPCPLDESADWWAFNQQWTTP